MSEHDDRLVRRVVEAASGRGAAEACPDAELLGLYSEHQLDGAERAGVESHVAACTRCQATVAAFVRSAPASVGATGAGVLEEAAGAGAAWWAGWKWLVPMAATAAVVTIVVWVQRPGVLDDAAVERMTATNATQSAAPSAPPAASTLGDAAERTAPSTAPPPAPTALTETRREVVAAPAPESRSKALKAAGARERDAVAEARERATPAAVPPASPPPAAAPREAEALARRQAESIETSRADSAAPAQAKAAAGQESAGRATAGAALGATAATGSARRPAQLTGRVTYRTRAALPAGAVIDVRLLDVSRLDVPATLLGRVEIVTRGEQVPVPFTIAYDAAAIDPRFRYTVQVTITVEGRVAYRTTTAHPVLTNGAPAANIEVVVEPMP